MESLEFRRKIEEFIGDDTVSGIKSIKGHTVFNVDSTPTIFYNIKGNIAKCATIRNNVELVDCWVVKEQGLFAHGATLHEAFDALQEKVLNVRSIEERVSEFISKFNLTDKYPAKEFFKWHHSLTGSCKFGRKEFCRNLGIDLNKDQFTVKEFIDLTKNSYGGEIIKRLNELY